MEIKINLEEVATRLAHNRLLYQLNLTEEESIGQIYDNNLAYDGFVYREEVQVLFDKLYDEYYNEILMLKKDDSNQVVREGWSEAFKKYAQEGEDELLMKDI